MNHRRHYTDADREAALALRREGLSYRDIASRVKIPFSTIKAWCRHQGLGAPPHFRPESEDEAPFFDDTLILVAKEKAYFRRRGVSEAEIARLCETDALSRWVAECGRVGFPRQKLTGKIEPMREYLPLPEEIVAERAKFLPAAMKRAAAECARVLERERSVGPQPLTFQGRDPERWVLDAIRYLDELAPQY